MPKISAKAQSKYFITLNYKLYEEYLYGLGLSENEASVLIKYICSLAKISIDYFNKCKFEYHEKLCNMDEGINQTSRG